MIDKVTAASGMTAYLNASRQLDKAADQIAKASVATMTGGEKAELAPPLIALEQAALGAKAAVKVLEAEKKTSDFLLDVLA